MILGILSCSSRKLPVPAPAWMMYSVSSSFSQGYQFLTQRCDSILIASAKYGVIETDRVIHPYNLRLTEEMSNEWGRSALKKVLEYRPTEILSLLPSPYRQFLKKCPVPVNEFLGTWYSRSKQIGKQGKLRRGKVLYCWPMGWILTYVFENSPTLKDLSRVIDTRYKNPNTRSAQIYRTLNCPLHIVIDGKLVNKYRGYNVHSNQDVPL